MFLVHNDHTLHAPGVDAPDDTTYNVVKAWAVSDLGASATPVFSAAGALASVEVLAVTSLPATIAAEVRFIVLITVTGGTSWPILASGIGEAVEIVAKAAPLLVMPDPTAEASFKADLLAVLGDLAAALTPEA